MTDESLLEPPGDGARTFLNFPLATDARQLMADIAIVGIPYGMPYDLDTYPNDQSNAPDALRASPSAEDIQCTLEHFDWDLGGHLLDGKQVNIVDCGNVTADHTDHAEHYRRAERVARYVFASGAILISIGGDHGIPIPVMRALQVLDEQITLVHVDAHLDWRHEVNGETEGYSSPIRRAAEMPWIGPIVQIGMRGVGSARQGEVDDARNHGCTIIDAYELNAIGMTAALERIPDSGPYYLTIDADGVDPALMPAVLAPSPGGLDWTHIHTLLHGLTKKGKVVGMDLVEIAPAHDHGRATMVNAERLICNFIGATVRAGHVGVS